MSLDPGDGSQTTTSPERRDHPVDSEGVALSRSGPCMSCAGNGACRIGVDDHGGEVAPLQESLDGLFGGGDLLAAQDVCAAMAVLSDHPAKPGRESEGAVRPCMTEGG